LEEIAELCQFGFEVLDLFVVAEILGFEVLDALFEWFDAFEEELFDFA
jgi:hypothetical protein